MARQVFFDPFGSYTQGYDTGTQREMQVQDNTRRARAQDFNYEYMMPLEYKQAKRMDALGEFSLPYQQKEVQYADSLGRNNVFTSNQAINRQVGTDLGITAPYENEIYQRYGITPSVEQFTTVPANPNLAAAKEKWAQQMRIYEDTGTPVTPEIRQGIAQQMAQFYNVPLDAVLSPLPQQVPTPQPEVVLRMMGPDGQPVEVSRIINPRQQLLDQWNRPQAMEMAQDIYGMNKDYFNALRQAEEARRSQAYLDIQRGYLGARTGAGPGASVSAPVIPGSF